LKDLNEIFGISVDDVLYNARISTDATSVWKNYSDPPKELIAAGTSVYSDSLRAVVMLVDDSLSYKSKLNREFLDICNGFTEFHFEEIDKQLKQTKDKVSNKGEQLNQGDFFITKHSNLLDTQVVFHMVTESNKKNTTELASFTSFKSVLNGLTRILYICSQYSITSLTIPILLMDSEEFQKLTSIDPDDFINQRINGVFKCIKEYLQATHSEDIQSFQFILPKSSIHAPDFLFKKAQTLLGQNFALIG